jgi:hypothetical protein
VILALGVQVLVIDIVIGVIFNRLLKTIYPIKNIPWAMPISLEGFWGEVSLYISATALAFPHTFAGIGFIFLIAAFPNAIANVHSVTYYAKLTTRMATLF